jgi:hypothetical protein
MQTMSNHKKLSQLSFAAVALLAAAIPCLAQRESRQAQSQPAALKPAQTVEIAALRNERLSAHKAAPETASAAKVNEKATQSRDKFNSAIAQAVSTTPGFSNSTTLSESDWQKTRRLANDDESSSSRRINFVPSRGQKLPE